MNILEALQSIQLCTPLGEELGYTMNNRSWVPVFREAQAAGDTSAEQLLPYFKDEPLLTRILSAVSGEVTETYITRKIPWVLSKYAMYSDFIFLREDATPFEKAKANRKMAENLENRLQGLYND